jgi:hypothetical protein
MSRGKTGILALYKSRANRYIASAIVLTNIPSYLKTRHKMRLSDVTRQIMRLMLPRHPDAIRHTTFTVYYSFRRVMVKRFQNGLIVEQW